MEEEGEEQWQMRLKVAEVRVEICGSSRNDDGGDDDPGDPFADIDCSKTATAAHRERSRASGRDNQRAAASVMDRRAELYATKGGEHDRSLDQYFTSKRE